MSPALPLFTVVTLVLACAALAAALPLPADDSSEVEVSRLAELPDGSVLVLVRDKRQNVGQQHGRYPQHGGRPGQQGGRPGGFNQQQGGRPGGFNQQLQQGGRPQQPSFGSSAANAQAQGFNAGNFGANSAGTQTQAFNAGPGGIQGSAGQSFSQNYNFPGGINAMVSGAGTFGVGPGGVTQGGGSSVSVTGPNGQPIRG